MKTLFRMFALAILGALALAGAARAQITEPGPYYALPSWDQQLPAATRWIVLTNWGSAAVLDRETGLVWQQNPSANVVPDTWQNALEDCVENHIGGRYGWRLPAVEELATLLDPSTGTLFSGAPFTLPAGPFFWTATTVAASPNLAFSISFIPRNFNQVDKSQTVPFWCVRSYQGTQSPQ